MVAGNTISQIARFIGCHKSTVSRELKRNRGRRGYQAKAAQERAQMRHRKKAKHLRFTSAMRIRIAEMLSARKWSPELICAKERETNSNFVSHETIYRWIWAMKWNYEKKNEGFHRLYLHLKHGRKRLRRGNRKDYRGIIPNRVPIDQRPAIVARRQRIGDMEVDLMLGKNRLPGLLVITDRASLKTFLTKIWTRKPSIIRQKIVTKMKSHKSWLRTMTYDNDFSFAQHNVANESLETKSYFTRPFTSQDKGTVENRIGIIRRFFPKDMDLTHTSHRRIKEVENMINERPVRKFNYQTPNAVFLQKILRCTN